MGATSKFVFIQDDVDRFFKFDDEAKALGEEIL
ncbi:hypothetical protein ACVIYL_008985 [Bradyrhizobium sp. USDA 3315]